MSPTLAEASQAFVNPLFDLDRLVDILAEVTGCDPALAAQRLRDEFARPGSTVVADMAARQVVPFESSAGLDRFYRESDAFLYELALWNRNLVKQRMRDWIEAYLDAMGKAISRPRSPGLRVLSIGDGLGFDCIAYAQRGHLVTYFEVPGHTEAFARRLIREIQPSLKGTIEVCTDTLPEGAFDAVTCLDVLEHVPDVPGILAGIVRRLTPGGLLFVHAPFYMIHPSCPTHLRSNRGLAGSARVFADQGLELVDGRMMWNPVVFSRKGATLAPGLPRRRWRARMMRVRAAQPMFWLGRYTGLPGWLAHQTKCRYRVWFDGSTRSNR